MAEPVDVLVVGCGDIAMRGHLPAIARSRAVRLRGVVDPAAERRSEAAERYRVPSWPDLESALSAPSLGAKTIDAVIVAVPPHIAPQITLAAVRSGLDVLCEKPMAVDLDSAEEVHETAQQSDRIVQIGLKNRFSPLMAAARRWIAEGRVGGPAAYTLGGFDESYDANDALHTERIHMFLRHGSSFVHEGAHFADYVAYLNGSEPTAVQATGLRSRPDLVSENFVSALVRYSNGDVARLEIGWQFPTSPTGELRVLGPSGVILVDRPAQVATLTTIDDGGAQHTEEVRLRRDWNEICFDLQLEHFIHCVRGRLEPATSTAAGLASLRLCLAVETALQSGTATHIDHIPGEPR